MEKISITPNFGRHYIRFFKRKQDLYEQRNVTKLRLQKYSPNQRKPIIFAKSLIGDKKTLIFFG